VMVLTFSGGPLGGMAEVLTSSDNVASGVVSRVSLVESSWGLRIPSAGVLGAIKRLGLLGGLVDLRGLLGFCVVPAVIPDAPAVIPDAPAMGAGTSS
jgi:hypothetical protein